MAVTTGNVPAVLIEKNEEYIGKFTSILFQQHKLTRLGKIAGDQPI